MKFKLPKSYKLIAFSSFLILLFQFNCINTPLLEKKQFTTLRTIRKSQTFNLAPLLDSKVTDEKITQKLNNHLWQSWNNITENLDYVANNINQLWENHPEVTIAFFTSLITDIRAQVTPDITKDLKTTYENLNTISKLWEIDNKLSKFLLDLDNVKSESTYFLRYLISTACKMCPARINIDEFKTAYKNLLSKGTVELTWSDKRDWSAAKHGVTFMSSLVSMDEVLQKIKSLESNDKILQENINIVTPGKSNEYKEIIKKLKEKGFKINKVDTEDFAPDIESLPDDIWGGHELARMLNVLQRPFRIESVHSFIYCYKWWKQQTNIELDSSSTKYLEKPYVYLSAGSQTELLKRLIHIRKELHKITTDESISEKTRVTTLAFDRAIGSYAKNIIMDITGYQQSREFDSEISESDYNSLIKAINSSLEILSLDRYLPHRLWLSGKKNSSFGELNSIKISLSNNWKNENGTPLTKEEILLKEINYLEHTITEIKKSMHGEVFEPGAEPVVYKQYIKSKFINFQEDYNKTVEKFNTVFPNIELLRAHVFDSHIALSCLRQIETLKDILKKMLRKDHPELFYSSKNMSNFLLQARKLENEFINPNIPIDKYSKEVAEEAEGLIVLNMQPYHKNHKLLTLGRKLENNRMKIYYVISHEDNLKIVKSSQPIMTSQYWNKQPIPQKPFKVVKYSDYMNMEEKNLKNKLLVTTHPKPKIMNLEEIYDIAGLICDQGGLTAHVINILTESGKATFASTKTDATKVLIENMPIQIEMKEGLAHIYPIRYYNHEEDIGTMVEKILVHR